MLGAPRRAITGNVHILIDCYGGGVVGGVKPCVVRSRPDLFPQQFGTGITLYT